MNDQQLNDYRIAEADYHRTKDARQVWSWRRWSNGRHHYTITRYPHDPLSKYLAACEILGIDPVTQETKR